MRAAAWLPILHHYDASPYTQRVLKILGIKDQREGHPPATHREWFISFLLPR